jgi:hypothetical protein
VEEEPRRTGPWMKREEGWEEEVVVEWEVKKDLRWRVPSWLPFRTWPVATVSRPERLLCDVCVGEVLRSFCTNYFKYLSVVLW